MDLARDAEEVADQLDGLVAPADEPENAVLVDNARAGFDVMLLAGLAGTGYFALRRSRYLATAAAAAATLLVVDAWFDVMTTLPGQRLEPVALAAGVELPLAAVCVWLSLHTQQLAERRLVLLLRRGRTTEARSR